MRFRDLRAVPRRGTGNAAAIWQAVPGWRGFARELRDPIMPGQTALTVMPRLPAPWRRRG